MGLGQKTHILGDIYPQNRGFLCFSTSMFERFCHGEQFSTGVLESGLLWENGVGMLGGREISEKYLDKAGKMCYTFAYAIFPYRGH